ncbi:SHOCT domain-containing protein [Mariniblastus fucicola]|uniref:Uncharacterized protein n=1 Tax=Mariniblastus fucicola TaxID=980251 RepID=A0A5B9PBD2_9BACT|nr:SHOCT domain-containing protein [Mariniblastus fucicola]QEG24037.1 hypothetical protein MFFC18_39480 [Mariniblastus fucicola]
MPNLSAAGNQLVQSLAQRHGISTDAATHMLIAVYNGNGSMAQFNHPEFGGGGQWMQGGMTMVSDLFNNHLKYRVESICNDVANELAANQSVPFSGSFQSQSQNGSSAQTQAAGAMGSANSLFVPDPTQNWWPQNLGSPAATGSQNNVRYAYFPNSCRLAVSTGGVPWVYDTLNHQIGGFSQQQGVGGSITFTSQFGVVSLSTLPVVSRDGVAQPAPTPSAPEPDSQSLVFASEPNPQTAESVSPNDAVSTTGTMTSSSGNQEDIIETLDRLGGLKEKGYITQEEFNSKKSELLKRL